MATGHTEGAHSGTRELRGFRWLLNRLQAPREQPAAAAGNEVLSHKQPRSWAAAAAVVGAEPAGHQGALPSVASQSSSDPAVPHSAPCCAQAAPHNVQPGSLTVQMEGSKPLAEPQGCPMTDGRAGGSCGDSLLPSLPQPRATSTPVSQQRADPEATSLVAGPTQAGPTMQGAAVPPPHAAAPPAEPPAGSAGSPGPESALQQGALSMLGAAQQMQQRRRTSSCKRKSVEVAPWSDLPASAAGHAEKHRRSSDASRPAPPPTADYTRSSFFFASCPEVPAVEPATPPPAAATAPAWQHRREEVLARGRPAAAPASSGEAGPRRAERSDRLARYLDAMAAVGFLGEPAPAEADELAFCDADVAAGC